MIQANENKRGGEIEREIHTLAGLQYGLGLGEIAPSPRPSWALYCAAPGWAGLSCACSAVAYCRFVPTPWREKP